MANFTVNMDVRLQANDGAAVLRSLINVDANAKMLLDDVFGPGPTTINLTPLLSAISDPTFVFILASGNGVTLNFDTLGPSIKASNLACFQFTPNTPGPSGPIVLQLVALGPAQRVQVFAVGNT